MKNEENNKNEDIVISTREGYVFVVDDDIVFLTMIEEEVKKLLPYAKILSFKSGESCLDNIALNPFLILLDYNLSGKNIDGIKTLKEIKKSSPKTEIVMLSGIDDLKVVISSMKYGAFDYILKGTNVISNVRSKIGHVVRKMRIQEDGREKNKRLLFLKWFIFSLLLVLGIYSAWFVLFVK